MDVFTTSYIRSNIVTWLPIEKTDKVLFFKNGIDILEEKLREMSENVDCVFLENIMEVKGKFDFIICIGMIPDPERTIVHLKSLLEEKGRLILALENKLGLKYLSGAKEEGTHRYFAGLEQREGVLGFTRRELMELLESTNTPGKFYYPFPDYRFAMSIYSDAYQPKRGELSDQVGNFDEERLTMFDEAMAADTLIEEGLFPQFSNSFLLVMGKEEAKLNNRNKEEILFVKFSNDRGEKHNIRTVITKSPDGRRHLIKIPEGEAARPQIEGIKKSFQVLSELFSGSRFVPNCFMERDYGVELEFLSGHTLEEAADAFLEESKEDKACQLILDVAEEIKTCKSQKTFEKSPRFLDVFGDVNLPQGLFAAEYSDIDMILSNILFQEDGETWALIDYEWSFGFPIPINFLIYRMIHYYVDTTEKRQALGKYNLYEKAGISGQEQNVYPVMEEAFQSYILGGHIPLRELYKTQGKPVYHVKRVLNEIRETERRQALVLYFDRGRGFSEEDVLAFRCEALDGCYQMEVEIPADVLGLRVDPGNEAVTVDIKSLYWKGQSASVIPFVSNGHKIEGNLYLFDTKDPNLLIEALPKGNRILVIDLKIETMSLEAAKGIAPKIDTRYRLKKMLKK